MDSLSVLMSSIITVVRRTLSNTLLVVNIRIWLPIGIWVRRIAVGIELQRLIVLLLSIENFLTTVLFIDVEVGGP